MLCMQKTIALTLLTVSLVLISCSSAAPSAQLDNPLYAESYYKELVENMMNLEIQSDPIIKDASKKSIIDSVRVSALAKAQAATVRRMQGTFGNLMPVTIDAQGQVLALDGIVYFGPDTSVRPGPEVHVYLSSDIDPRSGTGAGAFPQTTDADVGLFQNFYGASSYSIPDAMKDVRTVVLWDKKLKRLYAFAQLRVQH